MYDFCLEGRVVEISGENKMWKFYQSERLNRYARCKKRPDVKSILIVVLAVAVVLLLGVILNLKTAYSLREYSITHDCVWTYQNTAYGDDRDWICK